jgi:5-methylcytosine-specific restriction enzyme subunit McrC
MIRPQPDDTQTILLREFESREVALPAEAYRVLRGRYAKQIDVSVTEQGGVYRVAARDYVGRIGLPGGGMLVVRPKVGVANLFYMLAASLPSHAGLASFYPPPTGLQADPEIFGFVLALLVDRAEALLRQGLYRTYVPRQEDLPFVRGRIALGAQLRRHAELKHHHVCGYADLTLDIPENRVLAAALRLLPVLLQPEAERSLVRRARALLPRFEGVSIVGRGEALALLDGISFHRLNADYAPVLSLCRLALQRLTLDERVGAHPFASFLIDMPGLFESFVTARLRAHLAPHGLRVVAQRHDYLDEERQVGIRPDVLVYRTGGSAPVLVLDAKYRQSAGTGHDLNPDLYQVSAYLDRYRLSRGVLVYPQFGDPARSELKLRGTLKRLHLATLDLSTPTPSHLEAACSALSSQIATLAGSPPQ